MYDDSSKEVCVKQIISDDVNLQQNDRCHLPDGKLSSVELDTVTYERSETVIIKYS